MMKKLLPFLFLIIGFQAHSQVISSSKWTDLFSYNNVLVVREDQGTMIAATENGIFYYTVATGEIKKLSKANGLHEVKITAFDYNAETKIGLVGYLNGSMDVITPEGVINVVDIPIASGYSGDKKINNISISGNLAVISVGYGVSIFKLDRREFGDSSFFINAGVYEAAKEATIKDNVVYAVTATGLKSHEMNITFPIFSSWNVIAAGNFNHISGGNVVAYANANTVRYGNGTAFAQISQSFTNIQDVVVSGQNIVVADLNSVSVFDATGNLVKTSASNQQLNTAFFSNSKIFTGTKLSGLMNETGDVLKPDGPYNNRSYKIDVVDNQLVISTGGRDAFNTGIYSNLGYYYFNGSSWIYPQYFIDNANLKWNILDAVINPANLSEIYFTNYLVFPESPSAVFKMVNSAFKKTYNVSGNTTNAPVGMVYDENNNLFVSVQFLTNPNANTGLYYYNTANDSFSTIPLLKIGGVQKPRSRDGLLFVPAPFFGDGGLVLFDYNNTPSVLSDDKVKVINKTNNLPANGVVSTAVDKNGDVWIGTRIGLRILSNPASAINEDNPQTDAIIIEENGLGEELFRDSNILQIEVDSGNQKWLSIDNGGVFYVSANGERTLKQFTRENSPLPSNSVTDIKVDNKTGKVYFVTLDGVMAYQGDVLDVNENFGDVLVYPNPVVYSKYKGNVSIRGLAEKTNIRITDAAGNLVNQAVSRGGFYEWNLNNNRGVRVASGIYFVLMTNADGTDTATAKIAVVN